MVIDGHRELEPFGRAAEEVHRIDVGTGVGKVAGEACHRSRLVGEGGGEDGPFLELDPVALEEGAGRGLVVDDEPNYALSVHAECSQCLYVDAGIGELLGQGGKHAGSVGQVHREFGHRSSLRIDGRLCGQQSVGFSRSRYAEPMATYRVRVGEDWAEVDLPETDGEILAVPIVSALVFRSESRGELVLQRRDDGGPADGLWELPGGGWLAGESPTGALARELMEETGLELDHADAGEKRSEAQPGRPFVASTPMVVSAGVEGAYPILHVVYVCFADGEPRGAEGESREPAWFSVADVKAMLEDPPLFTGPTYAALTAYFDS